LSTEPGELAMFRQSAAVFRDVLAAVKPGQYSAPTPCAEWDVRTVVSHVILGNRWAVDMLTTGAGSWPPGEDALGDAEPLAAFDESVARVMDAFGAPGAMEKVVALPMGDHSASMLLGIAGGQFLEHAWDIAKATGQSTDIAPELCEETLEASRGALNDQTRGDFYGPEQPAPAGATAADRMAAFMGRKV
jgi:uncharacterized protein (TIGR03086 family)